MVILGIFKVLLGILLHSAYYNSKIIIRSYMHLIFFSTASLVAKVFCPKINGWNGCSKFLKASLVKRPWTFLFGVYKKLSNPASNQDL